VRSPAYFRRCSAIWTASVLSLLWPNRIARSGFDHGATVRLPNVIALTRCGVLGRFADLSCLGPVALIEGSATTIPQLQHSRRRSFDTAGISNRGEKPATGGAGRGQAPHYAVLATFPLRLESAGLVKEKLIRVTKQCGETPVLVRHALKGESSIQAGAWSLGFSHPRTSTSTPALRSWSESEGLMSRWSIRRPELRS
jgi:hypothetical protein